MATRSHPESARIIREARQAAGLTQLEPPEGNGPADQQDNEKQNNEDNLQF